VLPGSTLLGYPVTVTPGAGNTIVLVDGADVYFHDAGIELDTSRNAAVVMDSAPPNPPIAATVVVDLWSLNYVGVRLNRFCDWKAEASAVCYTTVA
jgi:hypothetical protein